MSELREQIADIVAHHCVEFIAIPLTAEDTHEYIADRILALIGERAELGYVVKQFGHALSAKALRDYLVDECKLLQVEVEPAGRADPQDCPTCRAIIEATMREMDGPHPTESHKEDESGDALRVTRVSGGYQVSYGALRLPRTLTAPEIMDALAAIATPGGTDE